MTRIAMAGERLLRAGGLVEVLDAAYEAFEVLLSAIRAAEDPADGMFVPLVMAGASAADGRDAIAFAPSLPPRPLHPPATGGEQAAPAQTTAALVTLCGLLAGRLDEAARSAPIHADSTACRDAARCARDVHGLLGGDGQ